MRELTVDRREGEWLVCISDEDTVPVPCGLIDQFCASSHYAAARASRADTSPVCPDMARPEGCTLLLFDAIGPYRTPYVSVSAPRARQLDANGSAALLIAPERARQKAVRARFDRIFKSPSSR